MKKTIVSLALITLVLAIFIKPAQAALIDNGDGTITDDDLGIMWLQSPGPDNTWPDALSWADSLVFAGFDNWRLPSGLDFDTGLPDEGFSSPNNEFGHLFDTELGIPANDTQIAPLQGIPRGGFFWTSTADPDSAGDVFTFNWTYDAFFALQSTGDPPLSTGPFGGDPTIVTAFATAVRDINGNGNVNAVPEPATMLLLGIGLVGLVGAGARRKGAMKEVDKS